MIEIPKFLEPIITALQNGGASPVLVGGFVRDSLLGIAIKDIDIEVYNISDFDAMIKILKLFGSINLVGKSFGILKLSYSGYELDFSLPRLEKKIGPGHKGFDVFLDPKLSFVEAAARRDFTINAMGFDLNSHTLLDPYNGQKDLNNKILTYVNKETFIEDPLRVLRAVQFCARFELSSKEELIELSRYICEKGLIKELPKERMYEEFSKLLLKSKKPSIGLALFETFGLTKYFPEISNKNNLFEHIDVMVNLKTKNSKRDMVLMLSLIVFHFSSTEDVKLFLQKFLNETQIIKEVLNLYMYRYALNDLAQKPLINYDILLLSTKTIIQNLLILGQAQGKDFKEIKRRAEQLSVLTCKPKPLLYGRDLIELGLNPSTLFSTILEAAYDAQLQKNFTNTKDAKIWLKNHINTLIY
ncbi:MAG: CCA tRNA nucleotidyltransferase [Thiovulaceae bacterium]|nr:CCA tRNA nucleotidyltransferase [Sulfurimonadaceae bacterium]